MFVYVAFILFIVWFLSWLPNFQAKDIDTPPSNIFLSFLLFTKLGSIYSLYKLLNKDILRHNSVLDSVYIKYLSFVKWRGKSFGLVWIAWLTKDIHLKWNDTRDDF